MREYKGYYITPDKQHPRSYYIATVGKGGKIPNVMDGLFTSFSAAEAVINSYLASKNRGDKDDEKVPQS